MGRGNHPDADYRRRLRHAPGLELSQAEVHVAHIRSAFGAMPLSGVRPSHVKSWTAELKAEGAADSYVYALHGRLSQGLGDAVHDGLLARHPCSRRT